MVLGLIPAKFVSRTPAHFKLFRGSALRKTKIRQSQTWASIANIAIITRSILLKSQGYIIFNWILVLRASAPNSTEPLMTKNSLAVTGNNPQRNSLLRQLSNHHDTKLHLLVINWSLLSMEKLNRLEFLNGAWLRTNILNDKPVLQASFEEIPAWHRTRPTGLASALPGNHRAGVEPTNSRTQPSPPEIEKT